MLVYVFIKEHPAKISWMIGTTNINKQFSKNSANLANNTEMILVLF